MEAQCKTDLLIRRNTTRIMRMTKRVPHATTGATMTVVLLPASSVAFSPELSGLLVDISAIGVDLSSSISHSQLKLLLPESIYEYSNVC